MYIAYKVYRYTETVVDVYTYEAWTGGVTILRAAFSVTARH